MDHATARSLLLEADPAELRGDGASELAAHLRDCAECRARADGILAGEAELDAALTMLAAPRAGTRVIPLRPRASVARRMATIAVPLAAAAAAAGVLLLPRGPAPERPGITTEKIARALFPRQPVVRPGTGRSAAVMNTSDPGVTLVWIY
ncbi:hypothetical protein [Longimicrobium sp.]|uniref:hypothetical protein n=1 Tax=Longimicrobium sp. TaxID=2029185 RepID=UPI002D7EDA5B|nr:hypothetical protein [Longimicrobium sp.]